VINQEADLAEYLMAQSRRELKAHPRSPIITSPRVAKDIDLSGIFKMSADEIDAALRTLEAA
jgi:hypothetical protein